ncbi:Hypothetical protein NGAL_HAMBI2566_58770 [Neorhizobium galegae bv. orientalis]|nr:Hypothetical protein NGAL_HAMBI2566_58770 [Neorhizobium galegae bv. orientalis]
MAERHSSCCGDHPINIVSAKGTHRNDQWSVKRSHSIGREVRTVETTLETKFTVAHTDASLRERSLCAEPTSYGENDKVVLPEITDVPRQPLDALLIYEKRRQVRSDIDVSSKSRHVVRTCLASAENRAGYRVSVTECQEVSGKGVGHDVDIGLHVTWRPPDGEPSVARAGRHTYV